MTTFTQTNLLSLIERSPATVAAHDKASWLALFAHDGVIEDPVGSRPVMVCMTGATERFYETFIAPNNIRFEVQADYFGPQQVLRDLTIHIQMAADVSVSVPMHLLYDVTAEAGTLKIRRLAAHWELVPMMAQLLSKGLPAWPVMACMSARMLHQLGLHGLLGFSRAALTPRRRHSHLFDALIHALQAQSLSALAHCFAEGYAQILDASTSATTSIPLASLQSIQPGKRIAAGRFISVSVMTEQGSGVLLGETCPRTGKFLHCKLYHQ